MNRLTDEMYFQSKGGLQRTDDVFKKNDIGTEFSRLINGFDSYLEKANEITEKSSDLTVYGRDIRPHVDSDGIKLIVGDQPFRLTDWSLNQFSGRLGIPAAYARKMAEANKFDLFLQNFNSWIDSDAAGTKFLVRTYDDQFVRGVLSDSYQAVDSDFLLPRFRDGIMQSNLNFRIDKGFINPEMANIRILSDRRMDIGNDPHYVGFLVRSSDVGRAEVRVEFFVYRHKCSNGMLFGKRGGILLKKRHTSKDMLVPGYFEQELYAQLGNVNNLVAMTTEALRDANAKKLRDEDMQRIIDRFKDQTSFGKAATESVFNNVRQHMTAYSDETTLWGVTNAITELAQNFGSEKAEQMEDFAGNLLFSGIGGSL